MNVTHKHAVVNWITQVSKMFLAFLCDQIVLAWFLSDLHASPKKILHWTSSVHYLFSRLICTQKKKKQHSSYACQRLYDICFQAINCINYYTITVCVAKIDMAFSAGGQNSAEILWSCTVVWASSLFLKQRKMWFYIAVMLYLH